MPRFSRSGRKQMLRAFALADALSELAGQTFGDIPESFLDKATFEATRRLFLAGVQAKQSGRASTAAERKRSTFMLGYRVAGGNVMPADAPDGVIAPVADVSRTAKPPFAVPEGALVVWNAPFWNVRVDDETKVYFKQTKGKERGQWIISEAHSEPLNEKSPEWYVLVWEGADTLLGPNTTDRAVIENLAEYMFENDDFGPNLCNHSKVEKLRAQIAAGRAASLGGEAQPSECGLAWMIGYDLADRRG